MADPAVKARLTQMGLELQAFLQERRKSFTSKPAVLSRPEYMGMRPMPLAVRRYSVPFDVAALPRLVYYQPIHLLKATDALKEVAEAICAKGAVKVQTQWVVQRLREAMPNSPIQATASDSPLLPVMQAMVCMSYCGPRLFLENTELILQLEAGWFRLRRTGVEYDGVYRVARRRLSVNPGLIVYQEPSRQINPSSPPGAKINAAASSICKTFAEWGPHFGQAVRLYLQAVWLTGNTDLREWFVDLFDIITMEEMQYRGQAAMALAQHGSGVKI